LAAIGDPAEVLKISNSTIHEARKNSIAYNYGIDPIARVNRKHDGSYPATRKPPAKDERPTIDNPPVFSRSPVLTNPTPARTVSMCGESCALCGE
jgi:hypothetical protein